MEWNNESFSLERASDEFKRMGCIAGFCYNFGAVSTGRSYSFVLYLQHFFLNLKQVVLNIQEDSSR